MRGRQQQQAARDARYRAPPWRYQHAAPRHLINALARCLSVRAGDAGALTSSIIAHLCKITST